MKVNYSNKEIDKMEFTHSGFGLRFLSQFSESALSNYSTPRESLRIDFHDLSEVDNLISTLETFKTNCLKSWGYFSNKAELMKDR